MRFLEGEVHQSKRPHMEKEEEDISMVATKSFLPVVVFSMLVMVCAPVFAAKLPLDRPQDTRAINISPQKIQPGTPAHTTGVEDDEQFALTEGEGLDRYLYRSSSPIVFSIPVERYYGITDGNGHLLHPETISGTIKLTLRVWDVDSDYSGPDAAPERDLVYINNYQCPGWLTGSSDVWSTFTCDVPVSEINSRTLRTSAD